MAYTPTIGFAGGGNLGKFSRTGFTSFGGGGGGFNINPAPQGGRGAYGAVPGAVGIPPNRYQQVTSLDPRLAGAVNQIGGNLQSALAGDIDWNEIQDEAARFGVQHGMPLGGGGGDLSFAGVRGLRLGEEAKYRRKREGLQDYLSATQGIGSLQTDPNLAASIATQNSVWASAPDPQAAAEAQMKLWEKQFQALSMGGGGVGTGKVRGPISASIRSAGPAGGVRRDALGFEQEDRPWASYPALGAYGMVGDSGFAADASGLRQSIDASTGRPFDYNFGLGSSVYEDPFAGEGFYDLEDYYDPFTADVSGMV